MKYVQHYLHRNFDAFFENHWEHLLREYGPFEGYSLMIIRKTIHVQRWDRGLRQLEKSYMPIVPPKPEEFRGERLPDENQHDATVLVRVS